jgi:predicted regulator of Ras-like GTPase activity (Roadblock/LC7/MglB family)
MKGRLEDMAVADLIQHNCQDRKVAKLELKSGTSKAELFFKNGNVVHAVLDDRHGEEAVYSLLAWEEGSFDSKGEIESPQVSITREWSSLLLEGMRRLDEAQQSAASGRSLELDLFSAVLAPTEVKKAPALPVDVTVNTEISRAWAADGGYAAAVKLAGACQSTMQEIADEVGGFIGAALANEKGDLLVHTEFAQSAPAVFVAHVSQFIKTVGNVVAKLGAGQLEDNLLTTETAFLLIRFLGSSSKYLLVVVDSNLANLGSLRHVCRVAADHFAAMDLEIPEKRA